MKYKNTFCATVLGRAIAAMLSSTFVHAATIDTTGGTTTLNSDDPQNNYTGNGTLQVSANGADTMVELGTNGVVANTEFALTSGGLIKIDSGITLRNGGWQKGVWTSNMADMEVNGTLDLWDGNPVRADALTGNGSITISNAFGANWAGGRSMVIGVDGGSGTFTGSLGGDGGFLNITKEGGGTQTFSGNSAHRGGTTVNGGKLLFVDSAPNSSGTLTIASAATLEFSVSTTPDAGDGADVALGRVNGTTIEGSGTFIKSGAGVLALDGQGGNHAVTFNQTGGLIDIQGGTLRNGGWDGGVWTNNKASMNIAGGAMFDIWGGQSVIVDALTGAGTVDSSNYGSNQSLTVGINNGSGTFSGAFNDSVGSLRLIKSGSGTQTMSGANTYSGGTTVNGGRLVFVDNKTGSSNFETNANLEFNVTTGSQQLAGGTINGTGNLIKTGVGQMWLGGDGAPQTIALTGASSIIDVQGGVLRNEYGNSAWTGNKAGLNVASGAIFDTWDGNTTVDELTGSGTINKGWSGDKTLTVGVNNGSGTFSGVIYNNRTDLGYGGGGGGNLSFVKNGSGTQTLSGANTYAGTTTVNSGTLVINGNISTSSLTTINSSGTLSGTGTVGTTTVVAGGTLAVGNSIGTLNFSDSLTLAGIADFEIDPTLAFGLNADLANVTNGVTYGGTLNVLYGGASSNFAPGMTFNLFDAATFSGTFSMVNLPALTGGLTWQNDLATNGSLSVIPEPSGALLTGLGSLLLLRRRRLF